MLGLFTAIPNIRDFSAHRIDLPSRSNKIIIMKRLLLAAFLLTTGMLTTANVVANGSTKQTEIKKAPQPPAAVLQAFAGSVAQWERKGDTKVINITWSSDKGKFIATFYFLYPSTGLVEGPFTATYNRQGGRI